MERDVANKWDKVRGPERNKSLALVGTCFSLAPPYRRSDSGVKQAAAVMHGPLLQGNAPVHHAVPRYSTAINNAGVLQLCRGAATLGTK